MSSLSSSWWRVLVLLAFLLWSVALLLAAALGPAPAPVAATAASSRVAVARPIRSDTAAGVCARAQERLGLVAGNDTLLLLEEMVDSFCPAAAPPVISSASARGRTTARQQHAGPVIINPLQPAITSSDDGMFHPNASPAMQALQPLAINTEHSSNAGVPHHHHSTTTTTTTTTTASAATFLASTWGTRHPPFHNRLSSSAPASQQGPFQTAFRPFLTSEDEPFKRGAGANVGTPHVSHHLHRREEDDPVTTTPSSAASEAAEDGERVPATERVTCQLSAILSRTCEVGNSQANFLQVDIDTSDPQRTVDQQANGTASDLWTALLASQFSETILFLAIHPAIPFWEDEALWILESGTWDAVTYVEFEYHSAVFETPQMLQSLPSVDFVRLRGQQATLHPDMFLDHPSIQTIAIMSGVRQLPTTLIHSLTSLRVLMLSDNAITAVPPTFFHNSLELREIWLQRNAISSLPADSFRGLRKLVKLYLNDNALGGIPDGLLSGLESLDTALFERNGIRTVDPTLLSTTPNLETFGLAGNLLSTIAEQILEPVPRLAHLWLHDNQLTRMPATLLHATPLLTQLILRNNRFTTLDEAVFRGLSLLNELDLTGNRLSHLPLNVFRGLTALRILRLDKNRLTQLRPNMFLDLSALDQLILGENALASLPSGVFNGLASCRFFNLQQNRLTAVPADAFSVTPALIQTLLHENRLRRLPPGLFSATPLLTVFWAHDNPDLELDYSLLAALRALVHVSLENIKSLHFPPAESFVAANPFAHMHLGHLSLSGVHLSGDIQGFFRERVPLPTLRYLTLSGPALHNGSLPTSLLCERMTKSQRVELMRISTTSYRHITLCPRHEIVAAYLTQNLLLESVATGTVEQLDVSNCPQLSSLSATALLRVDISRTNLPYDASLCSTVGTSTFLAQDLHNPVFRDQAIAAQLLQRCLRNADIIDLSSNPWLFNLELIRSVTGEPVVLLDPATVQLRFNPIHFLDTGAPVTAVRQSAPLLIMRQSPVECGLEVFFVLFFAREPGTAYTFNCDCSAGHRLAGNTCEIDALSKEQIAALTTGTTLISLAIVAYFVWKALKKRAREKALLTNDIELKQRLLEHHEEEVELLKRAWQIDYDELILEKKLDEGAFGEVWKAQWETIIVAVKLMKYASVVQEMPHMMDDFDKELEFLRHTRHPHLVKFFGTGLDPHGAPFIVLEFVALGSLQGLLKNGLATLLARHGPLLVERGQLPGFLDVDAMALHGRVQRAGQPGRDRGRSEGGSVTSATSATSVVSAIPHDYKSKDISYYDGILPSDESDTSDDDDDGSDSDDSDDDHHSTSSSSSERASYNEKEEGGEGGEGEEGEDGEGRRQKGVRERATETKKLLGSDSARMDSGNGSKWTPASSREASLNASAPQFVKDESMRTRKQKKHIENQWKKLDPLRWLKRRMALDIAKGMQFLHRRGVLHRDLKSGNVLVSRMLTCKLTDFGSMRQIIQGNVDTVTAVQQQDMKSSNNFFAGIAATTLSSGDEDALLAQQGQVANSAVDVAKLQYTLQNMMTSLSVTATTGVGTPLYMAPEVLQMAKHATSKGDVFSYGVLLWEIEMEKIPDLILYELGNYNGPVFSTLIRLYTDGLRLKFPKQVHVDGWYKTLSHMCMETEPSSRPSFDDIVLREEWYRGYGLVYKDPATRTETSESSRSKLSTISYS